MSKSLASTYSPDDAIRAALGEMLSETPVCAEPRRDAIDTRCLISAFARQWPDADEATFRTLDHFARRLAINKGLDESYTVEGRRETAPRELTANDHYCASMVLLAFAFVRNPKCKGGALHLINGSLLARDRSRGQSTSHLDALCAQLIAGLIHG